MHIHFVFQIYNKVISDFNGCYKLENLRFNGTICKTNVPSNTACRAFGSSEGLIIMEDIIFNIACSLGISQQEVGLDFLFNKYYISSRKHLRTKVTPDFHLTYSQNGGNLGSESK